MDKDTTGPVYICSYGLKGIPLTKVPNTLPEKLMQDFVPDSGASLLKVLPRIERYCKQAGLELQFKKLVDIMQRNAISPKQR